MSGLSFPRDAAGLQPGVAGKVLVVSCYCRREEHAPDNYDWPAMIGLLDASARRVGADHLCITDPPTAPTLPCDTFAVEGLPTPMMPMWIAAQKAFLDSARPEGRDVVLVGSDCLIGKPLAPAFGDDFDVAVTTRPGGGRSNLNNGAIYVPAHGLDHARALHARAAATVKKHWGADQESIADAVAPVPDYWRTELRHGARIAFRPMSTHNAPPDRDRGPVDAYVIHFKGARKGFLARWAAQHLGLQPLTRAAGLAGGGGARRST